MKNQKILQADWTMVDSLSDYKGYDYITILDEYKGTSGKTLSGYGSKIPTDYKVFHQGRLYRVYSKIYSTIGSLYITVMGKEILLH